MTGRRLYEVTLAGHLGPSLAASFAPLSVTTANGQTTIAGPGLDAAMLHGVLRTVERLGLELVSVQSHVNDAG